MEEFLFWSVAMHSVQEFMNFSATTIAERTATGQRQSVESESTLVWNKLSHRSSCWACLCIDNVAHTYSHPQGPIGIIISDKEYPSRVAFSLLNKILDEFLVKFPPTNWTPPVQYPELADYISKYQDPKQADTIMRVQNELDETTAILVGIDFSTWRTLQLTCSTIAQDYRVCTTARWEGKRTYYFVSRAFADLHGM